MSEKSTKRLMANFILNSGEDSCAVCVYNKECNEKFAKAEKENTTYFPEERECENGIISYFESQKCKS